jgi:glutathione S-transferase
MPNGLPVGQPARCRLMLPSAGQIQNYQQAEGFLSSGRLLLQPFRHYSGIPTVVKMPLKVFGLPWDQATRAVCMLLDDSFIQYEYHSVNDSHQHEATLARPALAIPTIDDNGFRLSEGAAILTYLAESKALTTVYPTDLRLRANIQYWLHWNHANTHVSSTKIVSCVLMKRPIHADHKTALAHALAVLNEHLASRGFLTGDVITLADYVILPELDQIEFLGREVFDLSPFTHVMRYLTAASFAMYSYAKNGATAKSFFDDLKHAHVPKMLKLYGSPCCQLSRGLMMVLEEASIPYDFENVNIMEKESKKPAHHLDVTSVIPTIDDNGFCLGETATIIQYLADTRGLGPYLPDDPQVKAKILYWIHWTQLHLSKTTTKLKQSSAQQHSEEEAEKSINGTSVEFLCGHLEKLARPFVAGTGRPTVADLILLPQLDQLGGCGDLFDLTSYPQLNRYIDACRHDIKSYAKNAEIARAATDSVVIPK